MISRKKLIRRNHYQFFAGWGEHIFFQKKNGVLYGCGNNSYHQVFVTMKTRKVLIPQPLKEFFSPGSSMEISWVSTGNSHTLFQTKAAGVFSIGSSGAGRLSRESEWDEKRSVSTITPEFFRENAAVRLVDGGDEIKISHVVAGWYCSYFICADGCVYSAGYNYKGQLGLGHLHNVRKGERIPTLSKIEHIATGEQWAMFLSSSKRVYGCGQRFNQFLRSANQGFLGRVALSDVVTVPFEFTTFFIDNNIDVESICTCGSTAYFLTSQNQVYCSGMARNGQWGRRKRNDEFSRVAFTKPLSDFTLFCSGNTDNFIVFKRDQKVYGCGLGSRRYGFMEQVVVEKDGLVKTSLESRSCHVAQEIRLPFPLHLQANQIKQIVTRNSGTYLITSTAIYAAGCGEMGQLMNGQAEDSNEFVFVAKNDLRSYLDEDVITEKRARLFFMCSSLSVYSLAFVYL